jgi:protein arginine N-methyltransferase 5
MEDEGSNFGDSMPVFYVGHHESKRPLPVSEELMQHAYDLGVCTGLCDAF